jgi:hypothetical protein
MEERWKDNPFGLRIAILGNRPPIKGAPIGGNKDNVVNPRNTFKQEDIIKQTNPGRWNYNHMSENNLWKNEA